MLMILQLLLPGIQTAGADEQTPDPRRSPKDRKNKKPISRTFKSRATVHLSNRLHTLSKNPAPATFACRK